jgi:molybdopterin converting factor small subunit
MELTVQLFGPARETAGTARAVVRVARPVTPRGILDALAADFPELAPVFARSRVAVNHAYADFGASVAPGDEVAIIPPVGGG